MKPSVKFVTFDVTNTLIQVASSVGVQYSLLAKKFDLNLNANQVNKSFKECFHIQNKLYPSYGYYNGMSSKDWWKDLVKKIILKQNVSENVPILDEFSDHIYEEFKKAEYWNKYPNCDNLLRNLTKLNIKLGVISNFDERLVTILDNLNILSYFKFILIPRTCEGLSKPDEKIFLKGFQMSKLTNKNDFLHVGDSYELDFKPALKLKLKSMLILHKDHKSSHTMNDKGINFEEMFKRNLLAGDLDDLFKKIVSI